MELCLIYPEEKTLLKIKLYNSVIPILLFLIIGEFVFFLYFIPKIRISEIIIKGNFFLNDQEMFGLFNWKKLPLYSTVNTQEIALTLQSVIGEEVQVSKIWPNQLLIQNFGLGPLFISNIENRRVYLSEGGGIIVNNGTTDKPKNIPQLILPSKINTKTFSEEGIPKWFKTMGLLKRQYPELYSYIKSIEQAKDGLYLQFHHIPFSILIDFEYSVASIYQIYWQVKQIRESQIHIENILDMRENDIVIQYNRKN